MERFPQSIEGKPSAIIPTPQRSSLKFFLLVFENADSSKFRKPAGCAPQKVVLKLLGARLFEAENFTALRIHPPDITCLIAPSLPAESIP
jgi:hypothetical protein